MCRIERDREELRWRRRKISSWRSSRPFYRELRGCFCLLLVGDGRDPVAV
jgi:hypothetical protein